VVRFHTRILEVLGYTEMFPTADLTGNTSSDFINLRDQEIKWVTIVVRFHTRILEVLRYTEMFPTDDLTGNT
jgi:hypothetical protein